MSVKVSGSPHEGYNDLVLGYNRLSEMNLQNLHHFSNSVHITVNLDFDPPINAVCSFSPHGISQSINQEESL